MKGINLFKNTIDVDGARAIRDLLMVNQTIEFIDLGHNRIRQKGLEAITEGLLEAKNSNLKTLGVRMNFINDFGFTRLFDELIFSGSCKLENLYVNQNNLTQYKASKLNEKLKENGSKLFVDAFEKIHFYEEERLNKTVWLGPVGEYMSSHSSQRTMNSYMLNHMNCLMKHQVRYRVGRKVRGKTNAKNIYMFVEYELDKDVKTNRIA